MNAPTTEALTASDLLDDAAARLDRLCAADLVPGGPLYELWRIAALHQAALREIADGVPHQPPRPARSTP